MSTVTARRRARRVTAAELDAITLPALEEPAPARRWRPAAPAPIVPRTVLRYRGWWGGPENFRGRWLVEGRAGALAWVDIQQLLEGEWDGQPATASLALTQLIGFGVGEGVVVVPGSQTFTASGSLIIDPYARFEAIVVGAGGGGGGGTASSVAPNGGSGGQSAFASSTPLVGNGGAGGTSALSSDWDAPGGGGGSAAGGSSNSTGTAGTAGQAASGGPSGKGGTRASYTGTLLTYIERTGGAGRTTDGNGNPGADGGAGGGGGGISGSSWKWGGGGGAGGRAARLWVPADSGAPSFGESISITVGAPGSGADTNSQDGGAGGRGEVQVAWD